MKPTYRPLTPSSTIIDSSETRESSGYTDNNVGQPTRIFRETESDVVGYKTKRKTPPLKINVQRVENYVPSIEVIIPTPSPELGSKNDCF